MAFKDPSFQDRTAAAAAARKRALEGYKSKPPVDEAALAKREAKRLAREAEAAAKREARKLASEQARAEKEAATQAAAEEAVAAAERRRIKLPTEAELKAARDARYAARKARQR